MEYSRKNYYYYSPRGFANEFYVYFVYSGSFNDEQLIAKMKSLAEKEARRTNNVSNYEFHRISAADSVRFTRRYIDNHGSGTIRHLSRMQEDI